MAIAEAVVDVVANTDDVEPTVRRSLSRLGPQMGAAATRVGRQFGTRLSSAIARMPIGRSLTNLVSGFRSMDAAASAFTGRMGTLGGAARRALQPAMTMAAGVGRGLASVGAVAGRAFGTVGRAATSAASGMARSFHQYASTTGANIQARLGAAFQRVRSIASTTSLVAVGAGITAMGTAAVRSASQLQQAEAALSGMYGSGAQAADMMSRLRESFGSSTIELSAFAGGAQALAYMGVEGDRAITVMKNLETALVTVGGGSQEMESVNSALLNISNQGKATAQDMNQISAAQIPIWDMLATKIGTDVPTAMDRVTKGAVSIDDVLGALEEGGGRYFNMMAAGSEAASQTMSNSFKRAKNQIVNALSAGIMPAINRMGPAISGMGEAMAAQLSQLPAMFSRLGAAIESSGVGAAVQRLIGGIGSVIRGLAPAIAPFATVLGAAFGGLLLVLGPVGDALQVIGTWMQNNVGVVQTLGAVLGGVVAGWAALRTAALAYSLVQTGLTAGMVALNAVMTANPIGIIVVAIAGLVAGFLYLWNTSEAFRNFWIGLWDMIVTAATTAAGFVMGVVRGIGTAFAAVGAFFAGLGASIVNGFSAAVAWLAALPARIGAFLVALPGVVGSAFMAALQWAVNATLQGIQWVIALWIGLPLRIGQVLISLGAIVGQAFAAAWNWAVNATVSGISAVVGFVASLPGRILGALAALGGMLAGWASAAWNAALSATTGAVNGIVGFVASLPSRILGAVSALGGMLAGWASSAWSGAVAATSAGASQIVSFVASLPGRIVGALGNLGSLLYNAGASIINGLLNGLKSAVGGVMSFVGGIADKIASIKGPLPYDRKLLIPHGKAIVGGLNRGLRSEFGAVEKTLARMTRDIPALTAPMQAQIEATVRSPQAAAAERVGQVVHRERTNQRNVEVNAPITLHTQSTDPRIAARLAADRVAMLAQS